MTFNQLSRKLSDASDLLEMVEHLAASAKERGEQTVPWPGVRLTLRQCREIVGDISNWLESQQDAAVDSVERHVQVDRPSEPRRERRDTTLASRIQRVPRNGSYVRELGAGVYPTVGVASHEINEDTEHDKY